jgi:hypothetical protein
MENKEQTPFNEDFCSELEYHLGRTFKNSDREDLKGFWCDGVFCEPINEAELRTTHKKETKAWIGSNGQGEYTMTIRFGKQSLNSLQKGNDLTHTIPSEESMDWIDIDTVKRTIEVRLN